MLWSYLFLGLAICAVWAPTVPALGRLRLPPWALLFLVAIACALAADVVTLAALPSLALLATFAWWSRRVQSKWAAGVLVGAALFVALCLSLHLAPGFHNPTLFVNQKLSPLSHAFTQYVNFDKGAAGLILLANFAPRVANRSQLRNIAQPTLWAVLLVPIVVLTVAVLVGYVAFDPKMPRLALAWLAINLLFTVVAEEAFFRGVIQEKLTRDEAKHLGQAMAVGASSVLFALAHFGGGWTLMVITLLAGLGYSLVYHRTRRIEAAIATHFAVNCVHFLAFTYPFLQW